MDIRVGQLLMYMPFPTLGLDSVLLKGILVRLYIGSCGSPLRRLLVVVAAVGIKVVPGPDLWVAQVRFLIRLLA